MKYLANTGLVITITPQGGWTPASPVYIQTPAAKVKAGWLAVLKTQISWTITGCSFGSFAGGGGGSMQATAVKCSCENQKPMRINDFGMCSGSLTGPGPTVSCSCRYEITNAGQVKTRSE